GVVATSLKWREAEAQGRVAEAQRRVAVEEKQQAHEASMDAEAARNEALRQRHTSQMQSAELLLERGLALAEQGEAAHGLHWMLESLKLAPADADELRRVVRINLAAWSQQVHALRNILPIPPRGVHGLAFTPDGQAFVAVTHYQLQGWNALTGEGKGKPVL